MRLMSLRKVLSSALSSQRVPHLSLANNTFTLVTDAENKKVISQIEDGVIYVDVHFVDANDALSKIYYKEKYSNKEDEQVPPTCFSDDSIRPSDQSQEKQADFCAQCPWNVWGTAVTDMGNKGKACRDMHKTAIIVPAFSEEAIFQLRIPPASLKAWNAYVASFSEFKINGREGTVGDVITRVYFEPGKQGIIGFGPIREVTPKEFSYLEHINEANLAISLIGYTGEDKSLPAPAPRAQISSPKRTDYDDSADADAAIAQKQAELEALKQREKATLQEAAKTAVLQEAAKVASTQGQAAPKMKMGIGQPVAKLKSATPAPAPKPAIKGMMKLDSGMRIAKGAPSIKENVAEAEIVEDKPKMMKPAVQVGKGSPVDGIPKTQMPNELQSMLKGLMDI